MANPIIRIKRGSSTPANGVLSAGELAVDLTNKNLFVGQADGSALPIGGEGTFATKDYVTNVTGSLGTMSQQNADSVAITGGTIDGTTIGNTTPASGTFLGLTVTGGVIYNDQSLDFEIQHQAGGSLILNNQDGGGSVKITASDLDLQASRIVNVGAPSDANDAVRKTDLDTAISALGTMATQNSDAVAISGGMLDSVSVYASDLYVYDGGLTMESDIDMNDMGRIKNLIAPVDANDAVRKTDLDTAISALGSVFHYVGDVSSATTPSDLTTLSDTTTGAYYKVDADGIYTDGATTFNAKVGDAFVKTSTGWQKLDNVDAVVSGTANEIAVTGDENAGYTVAIDSAFSGRVNNLEIKTEYQSQGHYNSNSYTKISSDEVIGGDFWVTTGGTDPEAGNDVFRVENNSAQVFVNSAGIPSGGLFVSGSASVEDGGTGDGGHLTVEGNVTAGGTVTIDGPTLAGNGTTELTDFIIDGGTF
jgi:hypothetical protein